MSLRRPANHPPGLTLVEILIALALVIASAFIVWPVISGAFDIHKLKNAGRQLQTACADARLAAAGTGQIHVFRYQPETGQYFVDPLPKASLDETFSLDESLTEDYLTGEAPSTPIDWGKVGRNLPEGIYFVTIDNLSDKQHEMMTEMMGDIYTVDDLPESKPLTFYPDGTSSTVKIILRSDSGRLIEIKVDGVSSQIHIGEPHLNADLQSPAE